MLFVFYIIKFWKCSTTPPWKKKQPPGSLKPPDAKTMIGLYTFDVGKVLHHSTLQANYPLGNLRPTAAQGIIDFHTFDVGKLLHHSTLHKNHVPLAP